MDRTEQYKTLAKVLEIPHLWTITLTVHCNFLHVPPSTHLSWFLLCTLWWAIGGWDVDCLPQAVSTFICGFQNTPCLRDLLWYFDHFHFPFLTHSVQVLCTLWWIILVGGIIINCLPQCQHLSVSRCGLKHEHMQFVSSTRGSPWPRIIFIKGHLGRITLTRGRGLY